MAHDHDHSTKNLKTAFFLNVAFTIFELIGGFYVNSVAIVSDAIHDLGDSLSLGFSWYLSKKATKKATKQFTYGYKRFTLLGALINSIVLIVGSVFVIKEAINRLINPEPSDANGMLVFAIIGVLVNGYAAWKMSKGKTLNERVVSWHLLEDVLGWVAVLIVSIVLQFVDNDYLDPLLSLLITVYIFFNVIKRLKETIYLFLQGTPKEVDTEIIRQNINALDNIDKIEQLLIWSLDGEHHVITIKIQLINYPDRANLDKIKQQIHSLLKVYHFEYVSLEFN